jgi:type I restriction enzyme, S subunit
MIENSVNTAVSLTELAEFSRETVPAPKGSDFYIGLANVERDTGELLFSAEEDLPEGNCIRFQRGDVLYSRLRPYLNKVHLAEKPGVASPEFFVLRPTAQVNGAYLAAILRSPILLAQTRHMTSGNTHPRLTKQDVQNLFLPLPDLSSQESVATVEGKARLEARSLRLQADSAWSEAKKKFGNDLIKPGKGKETT